MENNKWLESKRRTARIRSFYNVAIVARAYAFRMDNSKAIAIYNGDIPIRLNNAKRLYQ